MKVIAVMLVLDVETDTEAQDATYEMLREQQRSWAPESCLIDYRLSNNVEHYEADPATYQEGQAFGFIS